MSAKPEPRANPTSDWVKGFFRDLHPIVAYDIKLNLAQGNVMCVRNLLPCSYPHVMLLAAISETPIIDDFNLLKGFVAMEHTSNGGLHMWHPQYFLVSAIVFNGLPPESLRDHRDTIYIGEVLEELQGPRAKQWLKEIRYVDSARQS